MRNLANNSISKGKLKFLILTIILLVPIYTNAIAQPFVSVCKNGAIASLTIHSFETGTTYQEAASSPDAMSQELWSTIPVLVSFCVIMFFFFQFLIQIIRDRKMAKNNIRRT